MRVFCILILSLVLVGFPAAARTANAQTTPPPAGPPAPAASPAAPNAPVSDAAAKPAEAPAAGPSDPFAWGDFSWMYGTNRQAKPLLDTKYFTGSVLLDVSYAYDFNRPKDDTVVGSINTARHNELNLMLVTAGGDFHWENVRATVNLQAGQMTTLTPRGDVSLSKGEYDLATAFRYVREAHAGYHWNVMHGLNLDAGVFMPYLGMASYLAFENWNYQPSFIANFMPSYLTGVRLQMFPTDRLKIEVWAMNGWQTYGLVNDAPSWGFAINHAPLEAVSYTINGYYGTDTPNLVGRIRLHMDDNIQVRYYNAAGAPGLSKGAIVLGGDLGGESGKGVTLGGAKREPAQNMEGFALYNRLWFDKDRLAWTVGGGLCNNPGRYLLILPPGAGADAFSTNPGTRFEAWDLDTNFDYMPNDYLTFRVEGVYRRADVRYFAGRQGVSPPPDAPPTWTPKLVRDDSRVLAALLFRM